MKIKVKLNKEQFNSLMYCTNGKYKIPVQDMLESFKPFLDVETANKTYAQNDVFVFINVCK